MKDIIIFSGAPGSGKTTVGEILQRELKAPLIDFGDLRAWHLNFDWSNTNQDEEKMAFENLIFVLRNYLKHEYKNIMITDLKDDRVLALANIFADLNCLIISLIISDDNELRKRILGERNSGFKNVDEAIQRNKSIQARNILPNEYRVDNTYNEPQKTAKGIIEQL
ncbi:MAG: AAA family ATPase [bacterium]|nr:AAA family ATPase [bacterium]